MKNKVAIVSLGCPKNQVDAEAMLYKLKEGGYDIASEESQAEVIIINTCGFIEDAKQEAVNCILDAAEYKKNGNAKAIIVTGCLAERYKQEILKEMPEVDAVIGIGANMEIAETVTAALKGNAESKFPPKEQLDLNAPRILGGYPFSAYIKIADGCDNCCTYCAIPQIRGRMRSRKTEDVLSEAKRLAEGGVKELIVVAQDTTAYGVDIYGESKLAELLRQLCKIEGLHWIRTLYTYPEKITDELIDTVASEEKLVKYFDIPLQHIDNTVLKRMNRKSTKEGVEALINKIRAKIPEVTLRTTFITGFPGETDEQFTLLHEFVKMKRFDRLGCFAYSDEEGTPAAEFDNQVDEQTKIDRSELIMDSQSLISAEKNDEKIGKTYEVLIEGYDDYIKCYFGRSSADAPEVDGKVFFTTDMPLVIGEFVKVRITDSLEYDLLGEKVC